MNTEPLNLLLADDDTDDCIFFKEALEDLPVNTKLTTVNDGVQLMQHLSGIENNLPHVLYLDLNMPRKSGFDCLTEIMLHKKFKTIPVIIFSTSFDLEVINFLKEKGAAYYIRKPAEFANLKNVIFKSLNLISNNMEGQLKNEIFVVSPD